jgi:predicted Fe-Mo cluster-binding NifX family protein
MHHMKIAITSQRAGLNSPIDPRFGRAAYFCIVDTDGGKTEFIENTAASTASQGAGIKASQTLADHGVNLLITGSVGPKAWPVLKSAGISVYEAAGGTVEEALTALDEKKLTLMSGD